MPQAKSIKKKSPRARSRTKSLQAKHGKAAANGKKEAALLGFRPKTPEDETYILQLTEDQLGGVHQQAFGEAFPREQFLRYLQSGAPTIVVEQNNKRIGYYSYLISPDARMHISALVIEPAHQSDGVGTKVMKHIEDEAVKQGVQTLEVFVQSNNTQSLEFTRKLGFVQAYPVAPNTLCFQKQVGVLPGQMGGPMQAPFQPGPVQVGPEGQPGQSGSAQGAGQPPMQSPNPFPMY